MYVNFRNFYLVKDGTKLWMQLETGENLRQRDSIFRQVAMVHWLLWSELLVYNQIAVMVSTFQETKFIL